MAGRKTASNFALAERPKTRNNLITPNKRAPNNLYINKYFDCTLYKNKESDLMGV